METPVYVQEQGLKISARDWLTNAAIMGYFRIQERRGTTVDLSSGFLIIRPEDLDGFSDAYFTYTLEQYEFLRRLRNDIRRRVEKAAGVDFFRRFEDSIETAREEMLRVKLDFRTFDVSLKLVRAQHKRFTCKMLEELKKAGQDKKIRQIAKTIEANSKKSIEDFRADAKFLVNSLKKFYFNKYIVGNYVFGNERLRSGNRKKAFEKEYVQRAQLYLRSAPGDGLTCQVCLRMKIPFCALEGTKLPVFGEGNFSPIAVSLDKFPNFFYNFVSNVVICPVCELLLLCAWAGFTKIPYTFRSDRALQLEADDYIFVNIIPLSEMRDQNTAIARLYERGTIPSGSTIYEEVMHNLFLKETSQKAKWTLDHVYFVEITPSTRKDAHRPDFRYFSVGKDLAKLFRDQIAIGAFKRITGLIEVTKNKTLNLRRYILKKILERSSTDSDCFKLLIDQAKKPSSAKPSSIFSIALVQSLLSNIRGGGVMDPKQVYGILKHWEEYGHDMAGIPLRKRQQISYKLLSTVRSGRREDFVDYLMKLYIGKDLPVPSDLHFIADDEEPFTFERKAYAFLAGFLSMEEGETQPKSNPGRVSSKAS